MRLFSVINGFQKMFMWMGLSYDMTKWFLNAVYFTYLETVFLLSSVYRLIHYKYAGEQLL